MRRKRDSPDRRALFLRNKIFINLRKVGPSEAISDIIGRTGGHGQDKTKKKKEESNHDQDCSTRGPLTKTDIKV